MEEFDIDVLTDSKKSLKKSSKRVNKDKKFGFGGQKRNRKSNTAESTADLGKFSVKKMKKFK
jgi:rRNA-processing protein EBP2